jgi:hypothetical protein
MAATSKPARPSEIVAAGAMSVIAAEVAVTETESSEMLHIPVLAVTATSAVVATAAAAAVHSKKAKEEPEESSHCLPFSSSFLFCFLFSGDRRSWLLLSLVETSADNVLRVEANDPTTDSIPLTIEVYIQGERTQVESRVRSGDVSVACQNNRTRDITSGGLSS